MKIAWFANGLPGTGGGKRCLDLSNRLIAQHGHEVMFYLQDGVSEYWTESHPLAKVSRYTDYVEQKHKCDVAICTDPGRGHRVGHAFDAIDATKKLWFMIFYNEEFKPWVSNPDYTKIASTSWFYDRACEVDPTHNVRLCLGGVDTKFWSFNGRERELGLMIYPKKAGWAGVEAVKIACEKNPKLFMMRLGGKSSSVEESDFDGIPCEMVGVRAHEVEKLRHAYHRALIYVSADSNYGWGFSQSMAEAMSCGCAMVGGDSPCFSDMILNNVTALTVSNNKAPETKGGDWFTRPDPEELADKILYLVDNPTVRRHLVSNARKHIRRFDYDIVAEKLSNIIEDKEEEVQDGSR